MREMHADAMAWLLPKLPQLAAKADAADEPPPDPTKPAPPQPKPKTHLASQWMGHVDGLVKTLAPKTIAPFNKLAAAAEKNNTKVFRSLALDVRGQLGPHLDQMREWNQRLMVDAGRTYAGQVADVLNNPENWGKTVEDLTQLIQERASVSESHAELIARDQTAKTAGSINKFRQQQAGVEKYTWSGSLDERERETHIANEGRIFSWDDPPAETGHPTEDIQCRCIAIPEIPELDDDAPDAAADDDDENPEEQLRPVGGDDDDHESNGEPAPAEPSPDDDPTPQPKAETSPLVEGSHFDELLVPDDIDARETVDHALANQPAIVAERLASNPLERAEFVRDDLLSAPPGMFSRREGEGRRVTMNLTREPTDAIARKVDYSVSHHVAMRDLAAELPGFNPRNGDRLPELTAAQEKIVDHAIMRTDLTHEFGHELHNSPHPTFPRDETDAAVHQLIVTAFRSGNPYKISEYAAQRPIDYFAEAFAASHHAPELLDKTARDMVESVVTLRRKAGYHA